ncbi:MAG: cytochrome c oxidase subunit II [Xanthobacteraceae bacterium]
MSPSIRAAPLTLLGALAGCASEQSIFAPHGPQAADIAQLGWILIAGAAFVLLVVCAALWVAICGGSTARSRLARSSAVIGLGIVFPAVTLSALLLYSVWLTRTSIETRASSGVRVEVVGEQWWWRVTYVRPDGARTASANEIGIPVGQAVEFELTSPDVIHSFWVPNLGGKVDMIPGRTTRLRLRADRPGVFRGQCAEYCGGPHAWMAIRVVARTQADHDAWVAREAAPAVKPATDMERRGQALFLGAGCGACHTIRGTQANGTIGPDLSHIGSRRAIAAELLPMTQANLARFIVDGQALKPGNRMPPFRIFSRDDLNAVAAYLHGLR